MKISTRTIISVVTSLFVGALASAQVHSAGNVPVSMQEPGSATMDMTQPNASSNRGLSVATQEYMYEDAMYDEMMMEEYTPIGLGRMPFGRNIFIIPSTQNKIEDHLATERDIRVMSHIFDRVLKKPVNKLGGVFTVMDDFFGRDSRVTQVIYLDGYGILFFMGVDFALVGPPKSTQLFEPNEPEEKVDTTWQQAERELYAPPGITAYKRIEGRSEQEYDAGKVELLKKNLVETLKHAANIRALKSDESVILTVVGKAIVPAAVVRRGKRVGWVFDSGKWIPASDGSTEGSYPSIPPSVLTIRAKKSDIDAFSKGDLDFDAFYARTQLLANWSGTAGARRAGMNMMR